MPRAEALLAVLLAGCATARPEDVAFDQINWSQATRVPTAPAPEHPEADPGPVALTRRVLTDAATRGLGHLLSEVDVTPVVVSGRFVGFRLLGALNLRRWRRAGADLMPGDVIVRINGMDIDRPERATACLAAVRDATELRVELLRHGEPRTVTVPVSAGQ